MALKTFAEHAIRPAQRAVLARSLVPCSGARVAEAAKLLLRNEYAVSVLYAPEKLSWPLTWVENPVNHSNWAFNFHTLRWMCPLIYDYELNGTQTSLERARDVVVSWIACNPRMSPPSEYSWNDHSTAWRAIVFCHFWDVYRRSAVSDDQTVKEILDAVLEHGKALADEKQYDARSNHGLMQAVSLLCIGVSFEHFDESRAWCDLAFARLMQQMSDNFCSHGIHLEQSPEYHVFTAKGLVNAAAFAEANGVNSPAGFMSRVRAIYDSIPMLVMPDGRTPTVGDSEPFKALFVGMLGNEARTLKFRSLDDRSAVSALLASAPHSLFREAGYYIARGGCWFDDDTSDDVFLMMRLGINRPVHSHVDALSFLLYRYDRCWFIDPGKFSYDENDPFRRYMRSALAHNTISSADIPDRSNPVEISVHRSGPKVHDVCAVHHMVDATHTRRIVFTVPDVLLVKDRVQAVRATRFRLAFHLATGLSVTADSDHSVQIIDEHGRRCRLAQVGPESRSAAMSIHIGERDPVLGWCSASYRALEPTATVLFETDGADVTFTSEVRFSS